MPLSGQIQNDVHPDRVARLGFEESQPNQPEITHNGSEPSRFGDSTEPGTIPNPPSYPTCGPSSRGPSQSDYEEESGFRVSIVSSRMVPSQELTKEEIIKAKNTIIRTQQKRINRLMKQCEALYQRAQRSRRVAKLTTETLVVALNVEALPLV
ncbi:hypothetical protein BKA70DRAFT_1216656 [Coprinopsis sp. MPI-PUGE-AT-0042]|nr:hypothetical protein BKA70DRAFT_1216656 [Coprinopsis sp. MPI-PUGE-AT-0042]